MSGSTNALYNQWQAILAQGPAAWAQYGLYDPTTGQWTQQGQAVRQAAMSSMGEGNRYAGRDWSERLYDTRGVPRNFADPGMVVQPYADQGNAMPNVDKGNLYQPPVGLNRGT